MLQVPVKKAKTEKDKKNYEFPNVYYNNDIDYTEDEVQIAEQI